MGNKRARQDSRIVPHGLDVLVAVVAARVLGLAAIYFCLFMQNSRFGIEGEDRRTWPAVWAPAKVQVSLASWRAK